MTKDAVEMDQESRLELQRYVSTIVAYAAPKTIILFGSRAAGTADDDADFDLCVIYDRLLKRRLHVMQDLYRALFGSHRHGVDIVVYELDRFDDGATRPGTLEATIATDGQVVYG